MITSPSGLFLWAITMRQNILDLNNELIIDNFAVGGGASTGIEMALGRYVDIAINHDPEAIAMHQANHPQTQHYCESVWEVNPAQVTQGRPVGLLWLSPDCKHFSKAKGSKPVEKKIRGLAWIALRWAALTSPRVIMLENVEEFQTWGPLIKSLDKNGEEIWLPDPTKKGNTFKSFVKTLKQHGYKVEWRELRACDYGAPTIRKRLFLIARCDGRQIIWPEPTHGNPESAAVKSKKLKPWRTAAECIDWHITCPSIFERKKPLAEASCRRVANGLMKYTVNHPDPFIVNTTAPFISTYYGEKSGEKSGTRGIDMRQPLPTQTTENRHALVAPVLTEFANASNPRSFDPTKPLNTICAQVKGGHFALVSAFLAKHYTGATGSKMTEPMHTVTSIDHHTLVTSQLAIFRNNMDGRSVTEPVTTVTADGGHIAEVRAFLTKYYGNDGDLSMKEPLHTITTKDRFGLVTVHGVDYQIVDIGLRMLTPRELYRAQGFPEHYIIGDNPEQGLTLTKTAQVRMCGNSVCPPLSAALVYANVPEMAVGNNKKYA